MWIYLVGIFPVQNGKSAVEKLSMHESRFPVSRTVTLPVDFNSLITVCFYGL